MSTSRASCFWAACGVVNVPIIVSLQSPSVPDLTIIDLPGITRTHVGDQPEDIGDQILDMIKQYAEGERSIILAVYAAVVDPATCQAFDIARQLDPEGIRTIGLVTQPDRWDESQFDLAALLANQGLIQFDLGFCALRNPSQEELNKSSHSHDSATLAESRFFANKRFDKARKMNACLGREAFAARVTEVLVDRIRDTLPAVTKDVEAKLEEIQVELSELDKRSLGFTRSPFVARNNLNNLVNQLITALNGRFSRHSSPGDYDLANELNKMSEKFAKAVQKLFTESRCFCGIEAEKYTEAEFIAEIASMLEKGQGLVVPGFVNDSVLKDVMDITLTHMENDLSLFMEEVSSGVKEVIGDEIRALLPDCAVRDWMATVVHEAYTDIEAVAIAGANNAVSAERVLQLTYNHYQTQTYVKRLTEFLVKKAGITEQFLSQQIAANTRATTHNVQTYQYSHRPSLKEEPAISQRSFNITDQASAARSIARSLTANLAEMSNTELVSHQTGFTVGAYLKTAGKRLADTIPQRFITDIALDHTKSTAVIQERFNSIMGDMSDKSLASLLCLSSRDRMRIQRLTGSRNALQAATEKLKAVRNGTME
ncbi:dynamin superfamily protein [Kipferlia bialata]|uniref:Dynamin superfamily protein n=1 Tax=Kipferlia bialata TaxID=797122 RepID=A0A9K3CPN1_9EUKA|nr:dynamin superfamily protein [Kipferlia bialata]|eukprot:g1917.t1